MNNEKMDFDKTAASWDESARRVALASDISTAIRDSVVLTGEMDVLDFGCGTGLVTLPLASSVRSVTGVDSSQGMLDVLRDKIVRQQIPNVRTVFVDLDQGHALEGQYHLVVSSMTFHHIAQVKPVLAQFHAVLIPSGYLCIADLDPDDGRFHPDNQGVFHFGFDRAAMRGEILEAGFRDVRDRTAAVVVKPQPDGSERSFSIFLMTAEKAE